MSLVSAEYHRVAGLGNKLFPWGRAKVLARDLRCKMLAQCWVSPRAGAITRGGIDYRYALSKIWLLNNFKRDPVELSRFRASMQCRRLPKCYLDDLPHARREVLVDGNRHFIFRWNTSHNFGDLANERRFLLEQLRACSLGRQVAFVDSLEESDFIAMNVRTGRDFVKRNPEDGGFRLTELQWFVESLAEVRKRYGDLFCYILSDGGPKQLRDLMRLPRVRLIRTPSAVADLLIMTKSKVLLGSGDSTFSAWGSFLGGMDTYSSPLTPFERFKISNNDPKAQVVGVL